MNLNTQFKFLMARISKLLFVISGILFLSSTCSAESKKCSVKIGAIFPLTGPASLIGVRAQQAAILSHEELPQEIKERISLQFEDTQMQPVSGLNAARKFIEDSQVVALTGFGSETVSAISSSVEKSRIPGIFVTPDRRPIEGKQYLFRHWVDGKDMLPILVSELQRRGIKSVALVYSEIPAMTGFGTYAEQELPVAGFKIAYQNSILPSEMDFRTISAAIRSSKADGVIYFLLPPQPSPFMKQLRQVNPALPVFSFINTENSEEIKSANGALEGVTYPGPSFTKDFIDRFEKRFGEFPEFAAGNVYDIIKIYGNALASGACSRDEFRAFISEVHNFSGALGTYSITDKNDFRFPVRLKVIKEGRFVEFVADK